MIALFDKMALRDKAGLIGAIRGHIRATAEMIVAELLEKLRAACRTHSYRSGISQSESEFAEGLSALRNYFGEIINRLEKNVSSACSTHVKSADADCSVSLAEKIEKAIGAAYASAGRRLSNAVALCVRRAETLHGDGSEPGAIRMKAIGPELDDIIKSVSIEYFSKTSAQLMASEIMVMIAADDDDEKLVRDSVMNEIQRILGTRNYAAETDVRTILNYGLSSPAGLSRCADRESIRNRIREAVVAYEPRIDDVEVSVDAGYVTDGQFRISIGGKVAGIGNEDRVRFSIKDGKIGIDA